jgi:arabinofuranosyltransferase
VHEFAEAGRIAARRDRRLLGKDNSGFFGYEAGLEKIVVDRLAITDPFLARLVPSPDPDDWRPGHVRRPLPRGYANSLEHGGNQLQDQRLHALYEDVRLATEAPLLTPGRAGAIWRLNTQGPRRAR